MYGYNYVSVNCASFLCSDMRWWEPLIGVRLVEYWVVYVYLTLLQMCICEM